MLNEDRSLPSNSTFSMHNYSVINFHKTTPIKKNKRKRRKTILTMYNKQHISSVEIFLF